MEKRTKAKELLEIRRSLMGARDKFRGSLVRSSTPECVRGVTEVYLEEIERGLRITNYHLFKLYFWRIGLVILALSIGLRIAWGI